MERAGTRPFGLDPLCLESCLAGNGPFKETVQLAPLSLPQVGDPLVLRGVLAGRVTQPPGCVPVEGDHIERRGDTLFSDLRFILLPSLCQPLLLAFQLGFLLLLKRQIPRAVFLGQTCFERRSLVGGLAKSGFCRRVSGVHGALSPLLNPCRSYRGMQQWPLRFRSYYLLWIDSVSGQYRG